MKKLLLIAACLIHVSFISAQEINTDRPDQSDGSTVIDKKSFQFESSVYFTSLQGSRHSVISSSLLRYGLVKNVEVRLLVEQGHHRNTFMEETAQSQYPVATSVKYAIIEESGTRPAISLVGYLALPFTNGSRTKQWSAALLLIAEKEFKPFTLTINIGPKQEALAPDWELQGTTDLKLKLNENLQVFAEYFAQYGKALPFHNMDAGVMYQLNKHWMVYASGGTSIHHRPENYFINTGFALHI